MKHEIKFRAWAHASKVMLWPDAEDGWELCQGNLFALPNTTLMQFTGLHDKNGKEIYEGDILTSDAYPFQGDGGNNYLAEVLFEDGRFHAVLSLTPDGKNRVSGIAEGNSTSGEEMSELEVVGNIHENPELLA